MPKEATMDFDETLAKRYSVRKLSNRPITDAQIESILKAAQIAPSAVNRQPYKIWVLRTSQALQHAAECTKFDFIANAPVVFVIGAKYEEAWTRPADGHNFAEVDASIAATHMMLEITSLGLGTTWVGHFDPDKLKGFFHQMRGYELICMFGVGYPAEDSEPNPRHSQNKPLSELAEHL